jgi:hypothetical protein
VFKGVEDERRRPGNVEDRGSATASGGELGLETRVPLDESLESPVKDGEAIGDIAGEINGEMDGEVEVEVEVEAEAEDDAL